LLWVEYRGKNPGGYGYSQFCEKYRQWNKALNVCFRQSYRGGERMFVDYAGDKFKVMSPETGQLHEVSIFVAVLGASNYTYAEAHWNQDLPNWIQGHVRAFNFFGGVSEIVTPDNLKAGVSSPCFYEPDINTTYKDMAVHYGITVIPTRIRKAKDKAKVEAGVRIVEQQIMAPLRNRSFFSIHELNQTIKESVKELNHREMKDFHKSRFQLFEEIEKPNLMPLPMQPYEFAVWKKAKVGIDYHVRYADNFYSVPYTMAHRQTEIRASEKAIEIYHKHVRIASHLRCYGTRQFITCKEHMPSNHQFMTDWNPNRFMRWAEKIGPKCLMLIEQILDQREHPQQNFRKCLGILSLGKRFSEPRLELACQRALQYQIFSYKKIKSILEKGLEKIESASNHQASAQVALLHKNIRGSNYFNQQENN
jgi:transposase